MLRRFLKNFLVRLSKAFRAICEVKILLVLLLTIGNGLSNEGYTQQVRFHHLTSDQKSGFGNVWAIRQDYEGFTWFGSEDGLYKYDGHSIKTYHHSAGDSNSIGGNFIVDIFEDSRRNLWIGTFGAGLIWYNREQDNFVSFSHNANDPHSLPNNRVKTIWEDEDSLIWLGTEGGGVATFEYDEKALPYIRFQAMKHNPTDTNSLCSNLIRSITGDKKGNVYIATYGGGISVFNKHSRTFRTLYPKRASEDQSPPKKIIELFMDSQGRLWMGTFEDGLFLYLPDEDRFLHYSASTEKHTLNNNEVETITEDLEGNIWVGTDNGLSKLVHSRKKVPDNLFDTFQHLPFDPHSLLSNAVKRVYLDPQGGLWVATYYGGINVYQRDRFVFTPIQNKPWVPGSLNANNVTAFAEDKAGNLWVGTDGGGLNRLPRAFENIYADNFEYIKIINPFTGEEELKIKCLAIDSAGILWIGYWGGGLYKYNTLTGKYKYFGSRHPSSGLRANNVLSVALDERQNLWIGTFVHGISYYERQNESFVQYLPEPVKPDALSSDRVNAIIVDRKGRVWVGGDVGGLNFYNHATGIFQHMEYESLLTKNTSILSLYEHSDGRIWVGTVSMGLIVYDPDTRIAISYSDKNDFFENVIYAIREDNSGKTWMSTNKGLLAYNPDSDLVVSYTKSDGLQGNQFNTGSALKSANGMMLFGGTMGMNAFYPDSIERDNIAPKMAFTNFWLSNKLMNVGIPGSPLNIHLNSAKPISLDYDQNSITVEFATLDYNFMHEGQHAYLLEGLDIDWQYIGADRKAVFTNLRPGKYRLKVKATNHNGFWHEKEEALLINIHPAWWQTPLFKVLAVVFGFLAIYMLYRLRLRFLIKQQEALEKKVRQRTRELKEKNLELAEKSDEIQAQNEELSSQNDQIFFQSSKLEKAQEKLRQVNEKLEKTVEHRTRKLRSTIRQLDKTVLELDRFVYSASHDLSAPLKSIRGLIQIAKVNNDPDNIAECLSYIENSAARLEAVIQSLVEYSRNTHYEINLVPISIYDLSNEVVNELQFIPEAARVNIENDIDPELKVISDSPRLKMILHNLIGNGIKYADMAKPSPFVRIECLANRETWKLMISDNGIGIDKMYLKKVFDMYFRASEKSQGSGLGLFIAREAASKLNGSISVESQKDEGTIFVVEFPNHIEKPGPGKAKKGEQET